MSVTAALSLFDQRLPWIIGAIMLAGIARGFSGFGSALIFLPLGGILYGARTAVLLLSVIDLLGTAPFLPYHFRRAGWRDVRLLVAGSAIALPAGTAVLVHGDPYWLRWALCVTVLVSTAALASGWRYRGTPPVPATLAVGAAAGFGNGAVGIGGPPLVLFWLGGQASAAEARSNIFAYFAFSGTITTALYVWHGAFTLPVLVLSLLLIPFYGLALILGSRLFRHGSESLFRRVAFWLCGLAGIAGLPVW